VPKSKVPKTPKKVTIPAYNLMGIGGIQGTARRQTDPFTQLEREEYEERKKAIDNLRHEELILRRENRIDREQKKQDAFRQQNQPQNQMKDTIEMYRGLNSLTKEMQTQPKEDPVTEAVKQIVPLAFNALMAPQPDPVDQLMKYKQLGDMFASNRTGGTSNEIDLKIEQIRGEREMGFRKLDLENKKFLLELEQKQNMVNTLVNLGGNLVTAFQGPITQKMNELGQASARHSMAGTVPTVLEQTPIVEPSKILIKCDCGFSDFMYFNGLPPQLISCPECGQKLRTGTLDELNVSDMVGKLGEGDQKFVA